MSSWAERRGARNDARRRKRRVRVIVIGEDQSEARAFGSLVRNAG